jgi:tetratricopeptide (TPR) repeat protein
MSIRNPRGWIAAALLPLVLASGCMSASKRLDQGLRLEERGRAAEAARRYVDALRRDPGLAEARERLAESGALAIEQYLYESDAHAAAGAHPDAADALLQLDALRRDAASVAVQLVVPAGYEARRREALDRAVEATLAEAERLARAGRHADALARMERAASRWSPSAEDRRRIEEQRVATFFAWSERQAAGGSYRAAYQTAERGLAVAVPGSPGAERLREVQARALEAGTVRVAVLPVHADDDAARPLGAAFVRDLENELELGGWGVPPRFVEVIDPREVRAEARRYRGGDLRYVSDAARLGRALDADLVVIVEIDSAAVTVLDERSERRTVRTRGGADTAFAVASGRREAWTRVRYTLVDVEGRSRLAQETHTARVTRPFREARYEGNWRQLLLGRDDQRLFEATSRDNVRGELAGDLTRELAGTLPRALYARVLRDLR